MFEQVAIRVSDRARSQELYRAVLAELEASPTREEERLIAWEEFALGAAEAGRPATRNLHVGFVAPSRDAVDRFWRAGLRAGASSDGEPGERPQYTPGYYGGFLLDPDGNSIEAVIHDSVRRGGNVDHLWIGVRDLDAAVAFYRAVAPHTGLRGGRTWPAGRQFRGAWATFTLVADGRPPTENLQIAFPAPDRRIVEDFHRAATAAGHRDGGAPGEDADGCYTACVIDPDGNRVRSVHVPRARALAVA